MTVAEISRHSYFRKSKSNKLNDNNTQSDGYEHHQPLDDTELNNDSFKIDPNLTKKLQDVNFIDNTSTIAEGEEQQHSQESDTEIEQINPMIGTYQAH